MCKVVQFTFDCGHNLKFRKSRCHGKFRKERRDSRKAACCAEPYLMTRFSIECGQCQQIAWEKSWAEKLERAQTFLAGLTKAGLPGTQQVSEWIKKMEDEHNEDAWNIRQRFPPLHKASSIERVKIRATSPRNSYLRNEVRPEDVVEPKVKSYMEGDDDDDYVRSTDPIHPVITNYSHPLDNTDDSWVDEYLSQEETKLPESPDIGIDPGSNAWNWGAPDASDNQMDNYGVNPEFSPTQSSSNFMAWGPDADVLLSSSIIGMDGLKTGEEDIDENQVAEVLTAFWECVHADNSAHRCEPSSSHVENQLQIALQDLTIVTKKPGTDTAREQHEELKTDITALPMESDDYSIKSASIPMDELTEPSWTDGAFDLPTSTTPAIETLERPKPPRPSSKFETMRLGLNGLKDNNPYRYYTCWLEVCRREMIYYEGKEGRRIPHPQLLKSSGTEEASSG